MKKNCKFLKFILISSASAIILPIVASCSMVITPDKPVTQVAKVIFDPNGGKIEESYDPTYIYVELNATFNSFGHPTPTRMGYAFTGWYNGREKMTNQPITEDTELKAGWEEVTPEIGDQIVCTLEGEQYFIDKDTICSQTAKIVLTSQTTNAQKEVDREEFNPTNILIGEDIVTLDNYFMYSCSAFNGTITFSNNHPRLTYIAMGFMNGCANFEGKMDFPSSLKFIGSSFMYGCSKFNSSLDISKIIVIGDDFLGECKAFSQKIVLPENLQYIGSSFMWCCNLFTEIEVNCPIYAWVPQDPATLSINKEEYPQYTWVTVTGQNKAKFVEDFPKCEDTNTYRNLKLG